MLIFIGISWMSLTSLSRVFWWSTEADFWTLALPQLAQGASMPFFFIPLTTLAMGAVEERETASAAGVMNFLRTMAGAVVASAVLTLWPNEGADRRSAMAGSLNGAEDVMISLQSGGFSGDQARGVIDRLVEQQAMAGALNHMFLISSTVLAIAAFIIWLAPRPARHVAAIGVH